MMKQVGACALLGATAMTANAGGLVIGQFALHDHPDAYEAPPPYGLRVDNIIGSGLSTLSLDQFSDTVLTVYDDGGNLSININGTLWGGEVSGNAYVSPEAYTVDMTYSIGVNPDFGGWLVTGFDSANAGTITRVSDNMSWDIFGMPSMTGAVLHFRPDGYRLDGDDSTWVGRGWITDQSDGSDPLQGARDWIFTATVIPAPSTGLIALTGVLAMSRRRR